MSNRSRPAHIGIGIRSRSRSPVITGALEPGHVPHPELAWIQGCPENWRKETCRSLGSAPAQTAPREAKTWCGVIWVLKAIRQHWHLIRFPFTSYRYGYAGVAPRSACREGAQWREERKGAHAGVVRTAQPIWHLFDIYLTTIWQPNWQPIWQLDSH